MPTLPIVLAHGYLGFGTLGPISYFNNVQKLLTQFGAANIHTSVVAATGSIAERSAQLAAQIRQFAPTGKVHIIAHSMGGLDARYLIGHSGGAELIASLTTLGSPFRGTYAADVAANPLKLREAGVTNLLAAIGRYQLRGALTWPLSVPAQTHFALNQFSQAIGKIATGDYSEASAYFGGLISLSNAALQELTRANCAVLFPEDESDLASVPSASYAGCLEPAAVSPVLAPAAILLDALGEPNDGVVPLSSAKLRHHRDTLDTDHIGLVGWGPVDVSPCYRQIYDSLA